MFGEHRVAVRGTLGTDAVALAVMAVFLPRYARICVQMDPGTTASDNLK
jgi:hypothetical protein